MGFNDEETQAVNRKSYISLKGSIARRTDGIIADKLSLETLRADVGAKNALFGADFLADIDAELTSIETRKSEY